MTRLPQEGVTGNLHPQDVILWQTLLLQLAMMLLLLPAVVAAAAVQMRLWYAGMNAAGPSQSRCHV